MVGGFQSKALSVLWEEETDPLYESTSEGLGQ